MDYKSVILAVLRLVFFAAAMISLSLSSFSAQQFEDSIEWRIMVVVILTISLGFFVFMPWICQDISEKLHGVHFSLRGLVEILVLAFTSLVIFLIKYPRFNIHSTYNKCSSGSGRKNPNLSVGYPQLDMSAVGALSFVALLITWKTQRPIQLGIFNFLLELTMDTSMEIPGNDGWPNLWYMLASAVYCSMLIFLKSYLASSSKDGYNNRISNAANGNDRSSVTSSNSHVPEEEEGHVTTSTYQGTANRISNDANGNDRSSVTSSNSHVPEEEEGDVTTSTYQGTASLCHESSGGEWRRRSRTSKHSEDPWDGSSIYKCCG